MADMDLQIKIEASSDQAVKSIKSLSGAVTSLGSVLTSAGNALDSFEKKSKKFGRDFTQNITAPIAALAGLSLKKVFDDVLNGAESKGIVSFAASVQSLKRAFDSLLVTIGTDLAPIARNVANIFTNLINTFSSLDAETRKLVINFSLAAAAIGPVVLAISSFLSIGSKILIVLGGLASGFASFVAAINPLVAAAVGLSLALAGIVNVFLLLEKTGSTWSQAFVKTFALVSTAFNKYIVGTFLDGIAIISNGISSLVGYFDKDMAAAMDGVTAQIVKWSAGLDSSFASVKKSIDDQFAQIGMTAGDAMTFNLENKITESINKIKSMFSSASIGEDVAFFDEEQNKKDQQAAISKIEEYERRVQQAADQTKQMFAGGMANAFIEFADGTESAGRAFEKFAQNFLRRIAQMILEQQILNMLSGFSGFNSTANSVGQASTPRMLASGGYVSGPGGPTSDSIPARLSNGEYVIRAAAVKSLGVNFLDNLNNMRRSGFGKKKNGVAAFADGGMVTSSAQAPQVIIQNSGTPKEASGTEFDPVSGVTTVILQDIGKNGPISKSIQSNFGVKRGNFR